MKHGKMLRTKYWWRKCCELCHQRPDAATRRSLKRSERQAWRKNTSRRE